MHSSEALARLNQETISDSADLMAIVRVRQRRNNALITRRCPSVTWQNIRSSFIDLSLLFPLIAPFSDLASPALLIHVTHWQRKVLLAFGSGRTVSCVRVIQPSIFPSWLRQCYPNDTRNSGGLGFWLRAHNIHLWQSQCTKSGLLVGSKHRTTSSFAKQEITGQWARGTGQQPLCSQHTLFWKQTTVACLLGTIGSGKTSDGLFFWWGGREGDKAMKICYFTPPLLVKSPMVCLGKAKVPGSTKMKLMVCYIDPLLNQQSTNTHEQNNPISRLQLVRGSECRRLEKEFFADSHEMSFVTPDFTRCCLLLLRPEADIFHERWTIYSSGPSNCSSSGNQTRWRKAFIPRFTCHLVFVTCHF